MYPKKDIPKPVELLQNNTYITFMKKYSISIINNAKENLKLCRFKFELKISV
jgi:hypothetical protein